MELFAYIISPSLREQIYKIVVRTMATLHGTETNMTCERKKRETTKPFTQTVLNKYGNQL